MMLLPINTIKIHGGLAQLGEHLPYKQEVTGSIPVSSISIATLVRWSSWLGRLPVTQEITSSSLVRTVVMYLTIEYTT